MARYRVRGFEIYETGDTIVRVIDLKENQVFWLDLETWVAWCEDFKKEGVEYEKARKEEA